MGLNTICIDNLNAILSPRNLVSGAEQSVNIIKTSICLVFCTAVTSDPGKQTLSRYVEQL